MTATRHNTTLAKNTNIKMIPFKSNEIIQTKESGSDRSVLNNQFSSVTLNELVMKARRKAYCNFEFQQGSQS